MTPLYLSEDVGTAVPTHLQCCFPQFSYPADHSRNILNGKFQKQTIHTFSIVRCPEHRDDRDDVLRHPAWHRSRPAAHRVLALHAPCPSVPPWPSGSSGGRCWCSRPTFTAGRHPARWAPATSLPLIISQRQGRAITGRGDTEGETTLTTLTTRQRSVLSLVVAVSPSLRLVCVLTFITARSIVYLGFSVMRGFRHPWVSWSTSPKIKRGDVT